MCFHHHSFIRNDRNTLSWYANKPLTVLPFFSFCPRVSSSSCSSMAVSKLEPELRDSIMSQYGDSVRHVYFNKGLWGLRGWLEFSIWHTGPMIYVCDYSSRWNARYLFVTVSNWCFSLDACQETFDQFFHFFSDSAPFCWINFYYNHNDLHSCWETKWSPLRNSASD